MMRNGRLASVLVGMLLTITFLAAPVHACSINGAGCHEFPAASLADRNDKFRFYEPRFGSDYIRWKLYNHSQETYAFPTTEQQRKKIKEDAAPAKSVNYYTVQAGDTLYRIAKFFGTTVDMLLLENHITDPTKLKIGKKLKIPATNQDIKSWIDEGSEIKQVFHATLTAYTAGFESTGKTPSHPAYGITASGVKVKENHTIAVDPKLIPLGTLVYIEGIGIRRAEDTGSAIKGAKIDVYIPDLKKARNFGVKKNVKVYVLDSQKNEVKIASAKP